MNESLNVRDTIAPKSDQLNADDLIGVEKTITVSNVTRSGAEQPLNVHYHGDDGRPFRPCKSMRRVLVHCWTDDAQQWIGKSMALYCDPDVTYGGQKVGGIRIRAVTDIPKPQTVSLTVTRSKRKPYTVEVLEPPQPAAYPEKEFAAKLPSIKETIDAGKLTAEQAIARLEQTGTLTEEQRKTVRSFPGPAKGGTNET